MRTPARQHIKELGQLENRQKIFYAYLAEDYDGKGQQVKIALARSSTSAGFFSFVASGDHGTGQRIPRGTRVTVMSHRGRVEILTMGAK